MGTPKPRGPKTRPHPPHKHSLSSGVRTGDKNHPNPTNRSAAPKSRFVKYLSESGQDKYDTVIKNEVAGYNSRFASTPGFTSLDWRWIKAMAWVESGPDSPAWLTSPLQIGNPGDPGLSIIRDDKDHSDLIASAELRSKLKTNKIDAGLSIRAAIAYLYHRAAFPKYQYVTKIDDTNMHTYTIKKGDSLATIAKSQHTTIDVIETDSGLTDKSVLHPGQVLKFKLAHKQWQINGWECWQQAIIDYNGGGDPQYWKKVDEAHNLIKTINLQ